MCVPRAAVCTWQALQGAHLVTSWGGGGAPTEPECDLLNQMLLCGCQVGTLREKSTPGAAGVHGREAGGDTGRKGQC